MSIYAYKASDMSGKVITGSLEADGEKEAVSKLQEMGYIPIRVNQGGGASAALGMDISGSLSTLFSRVSTKDVTFFTQDLAALLEAGLPVDRAMTILIDVVENRNFKAVVRDVLKAVQGGAYLSDAMAQHPGAFSGFYVNMVRAGEAGGVLEPVLQRLGVFMESSQELKDYIKSALVYPLFLAFVGGISIIILMTFVIPRFSVIFADMRTTIPLSTRFLLGLSDWLRHYWWTLIIAAGMAGIGWRQYIRSPGGRVQVDRNKMRLPVIGDIVRKVEAARFARTLGTLVKSGVPILKALKLVREIISNKVIAGAMDAVYERVKSGERLSIPLNDAGVFPAMAVQMITVGEESGRLDEMLLRVAENYEKVVRNTVKRAISLLEPAMILMMGLVIGFIVISMLLAIFSINDMPF